MKSICSSALLLLAALLGRQADAFSATTATATATSAPTTVFEGLQSTPLIRASDSSPVLLTSLWRADTPFGVGDETAVCAFLRHYG